MPENLENNVKEVWKVKLSSNPDEEVKPYFQRAKIDNLFQTFKDAFYHLFKINHAHSYS